jgi:hypothetical protein
MLWDIAAVIGFIFLSISALIGVAFTWRAWTFAGMLALEEYKHRKLNNATKDVAAKIILAGIAEEEAKEKNANR